jgi:hypothetical protein
MFEFNLAIREVPPDILKEATAGPRPGLSRSTPGQVSRRLPALWLNRSASAILKSE